MDDSELTDLKRFHWTLDETSALLQVWSDRDFQKPLQSTTRNILVYSKIAKELKRVHGISRTAIQCREKIKKLKASYKKTREKNLSDWGRQQECPFYHVLASVFDVILDGNRGSSPPDIDEDSEDLPRTDEDMDCSLNHHHHPSSRGEQSSRQQHTPTTSLSREDVTSVGLNRSSNVVSEESGDQGPMLIYMKDKLVTILNEELNQQQSGVRDSLDQQQKPSQTSSSSSHESLEKNKLLMSQGAADHEVQEEEIDRKPVLLLSHDDSTQRPQPSLEGLDQQHKTVRGGIFYPREHLDQRQSLGESLDPCPSPGGNLNQHPFLGKNLDQRPSIGKNMDQQPSTSQKSHHHMNKSTSGQETRRGKKRKTPPPDLDVNVTVRSFKDLMENTIRTFSEAEDRRLDKLLEMEKRRQRNEHKQVMTMLSVLSRVLGVDGMRQGSKSIDEDEDDSEDDNV